MSDSAPDSIFRILLVEDAPDQSLLLSALLQKLGPFDVTLSQDGVQALERAQEGGFDLVLTDLNLPGMDGFELTRKLKSAFPDLPVLAATGYTDPNYVEGAYRAGVDALMTKPVDPEDLESRLRELLPRWRSGGERPPTVIAVGARPGDVEVGCGASLAAHQAAGHDVLVFVLDSGDERAASRARKASDHLGVRIVLADTASNGGDLDGRRLLLRKVVDELKPTWAYLPSVSDRDSGRRDAHAVARAAMGRIPTVLAYATPSASLSFAPGVYRDVSRWMDTKLESLAIYADSDQRGETSPDFAVAQARYWGRFKDFSEVEPFELLDSETASRPVEPADAEAAADVHSPAAAPTAPRSEPAPVPETPREPPAVVEGPSAPPTDAPPRPDRRVPPPPVMPPAMPRGGPRPDARGRGDTA